MQNTPMPWQGPGATAFAFKGKIPLIACRPARFRVKLRAIRALSGVTVKMRLTQGSQVWEHTQPVTLSFTAGSTVGQSNYTAEAVFDIKPADTDVLKNFLRDIVGIQFEVIPSVSSGVDPIFGVKNAYSNYVNSEFTFITSKLINLIPLSYTDSRGVSQTPYSSQERTNLENQWNLTLKTLLPYSWFKENGDPGQYVSWATTENKPFCYGGDPGVTIDNAWTAVDSVAGTDRLKLWVGSVKYHSDFKPIYGGSKFRRHVIPSLNAPLYPGNAGTINDYYVTIFHELSHGIGCWHIPYSAQKGLVLHPDDGFSGGQNIFDEFWVTNLETPGSTYQAGSIGVPNLISAQLDAGMPIAMSESSSNSKDCMAYDYPPSYFGLSDYLWGRWADALKLGRVPPTPLPNTRNWMIP